MRARAWLIPLLLERLASHEVSELSALFEQNGLPFAPITRPQDLLEAPHLNATGGLVRLTLPDGRATKVPLLPLVLDGQRPGVRLNSRGLTNTARSCCANWATTTRRSLG